MGFFPSYNGDLRDTLVGLQGVPVSTGVARAPRDSPTVAAGAKVPTGFLSRADMDLGFPLGHPQGSKASSRVEPCKSALLSS